MVVIKDRKNLDFMLLTAISTDLTYGRTTCFWGRAGFDFVFLCINCQPLIYQIAQLFFKVVHTLFDFSPHKNILLM